MIGLAVGLLVAGSVIAAALASLRIVGGPTHSDRVVALKVLTPSLTRTGRSDSWPHTS